MVVVHSALLALVVSATSGTGFLSSRTTYTRAHVGGLIPSDEVAQLSELVEANGQMKIEYGERSLAYADASFIFQAAGNYRTVDSTGNEVDARPKDVASARPLVSLNELYVLQEFFPALNLLIGKKRLTWGAGLAYNPTDVLNVRKDPTDPTSQRAGVWMARLEVPTEWVTGTLLFSPAVMKSVSGLPYQFLVWPDWDKKDSQVHYQVAARLYALLFDSDVNLMFFYGNQYNDVFERKPRVGLSFSRYFFKDYELHVEALFQSGSTRDYVNGKCVTSGLAAAACVKDGDAVISKRELNSTTVLPRLLVGARRQFDDDSMLSIEYLYQADGYTPEDAQNLVSGLDLVRQANALGIAVPGVSNFFSGSSADGVPQKFSFEPTRRHYLFASYQKPQIRDDFTFQLVVIANLEDLSTMWTPSLAWSVTQWLNLSAFVFLPVPGLIEKGSTVPSTNEVMTEYGMVPMTFRAMFEARLYY